MIVDLPEWAQCLYDEELRYIAISGGRGSAKSRSVATVLLTRAAKKPMRWLCAREVQRSIRDSVKRLLDDEIDRLKLGGFYTSTDTEIRGRNGSLLIFAGLRTNIDSIKSMEGLDGIWIEEAQSVSQKSLDTVIPTIRKPGSQIILTWNPKLEQDPVEQMFRIPPPRSHVVRVNYWNNPWFPEVLREEMENDKERDMDKYLHIWEGGYIKNSEARIFKNWTVESFEAPKDTIHRLGADWGFAKDPTVLVRCHIDKKKLFIDYEAYKVGCPITRTPDLFLTVPDSEKFEIRADNARPELIDHMKANSFPKITAATKGANSIVEGIEFLKDYEIIVHPRCKHTIDELTLYSYKVDEATGQITNIIKDEHNHVIDALRYALESDRRLKKREDRKPVQVEMIPIRHHWRR